MEDVRGLIHTRKAGVSDLDINSTEHQLGATFPKQYRELFKLVNNAEIGEWILFPVKDPKNVAKTWDDIVRQNQDVRDESMPPDLIAIGEDGTGDTLCLKVLDGKMEDEVYIWYHETDEVEDIAPNLKEFIMFSSADDEIDEDEDD